MQANLKGTDKAASVAVPDVPMLLKVHGSIEQASNIALSRGRYDNLLSNGAAPKDVQELLGHADVSTTMNIYALATREAKRSSVRLLDKVVGGG